MKFRNGRQVFIIDNRRGDFYPVQDIIIDMLKHWNQKAKSTSLFDLHSEKDWQYAGERLAAEMGADKVLITDDAGDLIKAFDKSKRKQS